MEHELRTPNWNYWAEHDTASPSEVIFLSLNIEPSKDIAINIQNPKTELEKQYLERFKSIFNYGARKAIKMFEFALLAEKKGWELPEEFPRLPTWIRKTPKWSRWAHIRTVTLWQATALSLGIEPSGLANSEGKPEPERWLYLGIFQDRLDILVSHYGPPSGIRSWNNIAIDTHVALDDIAIKANDFGWDLPDEFPSKKRMASQAELLNHASPFIEFMLRGATALDLTKENRVPAIKVQDWIKKNWPPEFGKLSDRKRDAMQTLMRWPEHGEGGTIPTLTSSERKKPRHN